MSSPATLANIEARYLETLSIDQRRIVTALLEDSYAILLASDPTIAERLANPVTAAILRPLVIQVQAAMILRVLRNPNGKLEESIDDYSYRLDSAVSTGSLYVSDSELLLLGTRRNRRGAFTIVLSS